MTCGDGVADVDPAELLCVPSMMMRFVEEKDRGRRIPGHGSMLDRFDALIFVSVAAYFVLTLVLGF